MVMTGERFQSELCEFLKSLGYWALNIPRNSSGAQPFDVLAIKGDCIFAVDCKVCSKGALALTRIESNQWTSFDVVSKRTNARVGIVAYYNEEIYWISYRELLEAKKAKKSQINLRLRRAMYSREEIKEILGRYM